MWIIYVLVASLVGFFGFGVFTAMNPNTKQAVFWRTVAETSGLQFTDKLFSGGKIRSIRVFGDFQGFPVRCDEVSFGSTDTAGPRYVRVMVATNIPKEIEMTTRELDMVQEVVKAVSTTKKDVGNPLFNERVSIRGDVEEDVLQRTFHPGVQSKILGLLKDPKVHWTLREGVLSAMTLQKRDGKRVKPEVVSEMVNDSVGLAIVLEDASGVR